MKYKFKKVARYYEIPQTIFDRLKDSIARHNCEIQNGSKPLKLEIAVFFIYLILSKSNDRADGLDSYGYIPLHSKILREYSYRYNKYLGFLQANNFVLVKKHSISQNKSRKYKVLTEQTKKNRTFKKYEATNFKLYNKVFDKDAMEKTDKSTGHLTKWLNPEYLSVNYNEAIEFIESAKMKDSQKILYRFAVERLNNGMINYKRKGKDNRLHHNLSNFPSKLRPFIRFDKSNIFTSVDIKSSQPFLLVCILNLILNKETKKLKKLIDLVCKGKRLKNKVIRGITSILQKTLSPADIIELREFIKMVIEDDVYNHLSAKYSEEFLEGRVSPIGISDKFYNKEKQSREIIHFDSLRDYSKRVMLEYLYCSPNSTEKRYKEVKNILPNIVTEFIDLLKQEDSKKRKKDNHFPIFLQNFEAYLILDVITKNISKINKNIPLYTIHDSIASTAEHIPLIIKEIKTVICDLCGLTPEVKEEIWQQKSTSA